MNAKYAVPYAPGDPIGHKYEVCKVLGVGGFGVVYLVFYRETESLYALKTFRDEYLSSEQARLRFRREAKTWIDLGRHPYLVNACFVDEVAGRLYVALEFVPSDENGLCSLQDHLDHCIPDLRQSLCWSVQFCYGMEFAYQKGLCCHRDIKPANILISPEGMVKISDFGLAGVLEGTAGRIVGVPPAKSSRKLGVSLSTLGGTVVGTPSHMAPEQFISAAECTEKSDIYSFGVVLYQLASRGRLPFWVRLSEHGNEDQFELFWAEMSRLHREGPIPRLGCPLDNIFGRCLQKDPLRRYASFHELRKDLENLYQSLFDEPLHLSPWKSLEESEWIAYLQVLLREASVQGPPTVLTAAEWNNKGISFHNLGRFEHALICYDNALRLDPADPKILSNKGLSLEMLGRHTEAIESLDHALRVDPKCATAWNNKGSCLVALGDLEKAMGCFQEAIRLDPRCIDPYCNAAKALAASGRFREALSYLDRAIIINPRYATVWNSKATTFCRMGRYAQALDCAEKAVELDPFNPGYWSNSGSCLVGLNRREEAVRRFERALEIDPANAGIWYNKARIEDQLGRVADAFRSYKVVLKIGSAKYPDQAKRAGERISELEDPNASDKRKS